MTEQQPRLQPSRGSDPDEWRSRKTVRWAPLSGLGTRSVRQFMAQVLVHQYRKEGR